MPPRVYKEKQFVVHSSSKCTTSTERGSILPQGLDMAKCRCQPVITYREITSFSQVALPALIRCSVDGDVGTSSVKE
jgi:hypothetical protein